MPKLSTVERLSLVLTAITGLTAQYGFNAKPDLVFAIGLGGLLSTINFGLMRRLLSGLFQSDRLPTQAALGIVLIVKLGVIGVLLYLLIATWAVNPIGLLTGLSAVVIAIFIEGFRTLLRRPPTLETKTP